jgi:hypothetical protein
MTFWSIRKRYAVEFIRRWQVFLLWAIIGALVLRFNAGLSWSFISVFLFGLFGARLLAEDVVQRWSEKYISPSMGGGISFANPCVWTFELRLTTSFLEEVSAQLSHRLSEYKEVTDRLSPSFLKSFHATSALLQKLVVEEYPSRVRIHLWLVSDSEPHEPRYDWFDLGNSIGPWKFDTGGGRHLWAYAGDAMVGGSLSLSGSWEWDASKKRKFFQLTLWVDHEVVRGLKKETKQIPPADLIFQIPLEPWRLCDEQGQTVYVPGKNRAYKAGDVDPFPYDEDTWEANSGEGSNWRWSWHLHMKTFNSGFSI